MDKDQTAFYRIGFGDCAGITVFRLRELVKEIEEKLKDIEKQSPQTIREIGEWAVVHSSVIKLGLELLAKNDDGSGCNHVITDDARDALKTMPGLVR